MKPNIGENIKKLRVEKQVTQEQLAEYLCISYQAVSKWENSVTTPDIFLLPKIAEYFEVPIDEIFKVNMKGYKNKAARLMAIYDFHGTKENFDKADAEFEKLHAENKADGEDMCNYGMLNQFHAKKLNKKAEELLKQSIEAGGNCEGQLIMLLASQGRSRENIDKYEEVIKNNPDSSRNWYMLAYSYGGNYGDGLNPEKALEICSEGLEKFPNDPRLLCLYADICRGLKRYGEAIDYYKKTIEYEYPGNGSHYYGMAFTYKEMGKYKESIWAWEQVIDLYKRGGNEEEIEIYADWPKQEIAKLQALLNQ